MLKLSTLVLSLALTCLVTPAHANILMFSANLSGLNEVPPNASPATGQATINVDTTLDTLMVNLIFTGLLAPATAAHIHCCSLPNANAGVAVGLPNFPGVSSGAYSHTFLLTDPSIYSAAFLAASGGTAASAEAALISGLNSGLAYANIHDALFPGGEIRGQFAVVQATVSEPHSMALLLPVVAGGLAWARRRSHRATV